MAIDLQGFISQFYVGGKQHKTKIKNRRNEAMEKGYQEFINEVVNALEKEFGNQYNIKVNQIAKNNGLIRHGLCIIEQNVIVTPTIYMEEYYAMYQQGVQMPEIIRRICDYNESAKDIKIEDFDVRRFGELDAVKDRIVYKLVNTAMNQDMLQDHPHIEVLDLSMVFQVIVSNQESGQMTITIRNAHMQAWGIEVEQLKELAEINTRRMFPEDIIRMEDLLNSLSKELVGEEMLESVRRKEEEMFHVLTNKKEVQGAAVLLYDGLLKEIAEQADGNLVILPSSVHECILLKETVETDYQQLKTMVQEVNAEMVVQEEVLSEHVYRYDRDKDALEIVM